MLRILYDDFDQKVKNIHDEMDLHHSYKKKACSESTNINMFKFHKSIFVPVSVHLRFSNNHNLI